MQGSPADIPQDKGATAHHAGVQSWNVREVPRSKQGLLGTQPFYPHLRKL